MRHQHPLGRPFTYTRQRSTRGLPVPEGKTEFSLDGWFRRCHHVQPCDQGAPTEIVVRPLPARHQSIFQNRMTSAFPAPSNMARASSERRVIHLTS